VGGAAYGTKYNQYEGLQTKQIISMSKVKAISKTDAEKLARSCQSALNYVESEPNGYICKGYAKQHLSTLLKQLKGEYPIL
jgi:hypothetical protein